VYLSIFHDLQRIIVSIQNLDNLSMKQFGSQMRHCILWDLIWIQFFKW